MKRRPSRNRGFTLLEILVAIAVLAVLASLLFVAVRGISGKVQTANCAARLREVAVAIRSYANEHGNSLPGPITSQSMFPLYRDEPNHPEKENGIFYYLWPYLGLPSTGTTARLVRVGVCPSEERGKSEGYLMNRKFFTTSVHRSTSNPVRYPYPNLAELPAESPSFARGYPFGYISTLHGISNMPWKMGVVPSPGKLALLGELPGSNPSPEQHCNFLFLDGHVETLTQGAFMKP